MWLCPRPGLAFPPDHFPACYFSNLLHCPPSITRDDLWCADVPWNPSEFNPLRVADIPAKSDPVFIIPNAQESERLGDAYFWLAARYG